MTDFAQDLELISQAAFDAGALALKLRREGLEGRASTGGLMGLRTAWADVQCAAWGR